MPQNFQYNYISKQQSKSIKIGAVLGGSLTLDWRFPKGKNRTRVITCAGGGHPLGGSRKVQDLRPFLHSNCQWHLCWGTSARTLPGSWEQGVVLRSVSPQTKPHYPSPSPLPRLPPPLSLPSAAGETSGKESERPDKTATSRKGDRPGSTLRHRTLHSPWKSLPHGQSPCRPPHTSHHHHHSQECEACAEAPRVFLEWIRSTPVWAHQLILGSVANTPQARTWHLLGQQPSPHGVGALMSPPQDRYGVSTGPGVKLSMTVLPGCLPVRGGTALIPRGQPSAPSCSWGHRASSPQVTKEPRSRT